MKVWNIIAIMLGTMIFLEILGFGLITSGTVLSDAGITINSTDMSQSTLDVSNSNWKDLLFNSGTGLLIGLGLAIAIGFLTRTFDWKLVVVPFFTAYLVLFLSFATNIFNLVKGESAWLIGIVITVWGFITVMFVFSIIEWFGGSPSD